MEYVGAYLVDSVQGFSGESVYSGGKRIRRKCIPLHLYQVANDDRMLMEVVRD